MQPQLKHWEGEEGDVYIARQMEAKLLESYTAMWGDILTAIWCEGEKPVDVRSVLEVGASVGINLDAIARHSAAANAKLAGAEPNANARKILTNKGHHAINCSVQDLAACSPAGAYDLVFTRGVLIHIPPHDLPGAYEVMYRASRRWIVVAEYYSPKPEEIEYRGQKGLLWKRDFAGEMLDRFKARGIRLVEYGFVYHRDPEYPQDDVTWFLMEKVQ